MHATVLSSLFQEQNIDEYEKGNVVWKYDRCAKTDSYNRRKYSTI